MLSSPRVIVERTGIFYKCLMDPFTLRIFDTDDFKGVLIKALLDEVEEFTLVFDNSVDTDVLPGVSGIWNSERNFHGNGRRENFIFIIERLGESPVIMKL